MTSVVHVTQVNMNVNIPTPPQPSDVTSVVHVTQVNMNVNIPTLPQPSDVTSVVHVTQVNMNVNIPTPPQPSDVTSVVHVTQVNMNINIPTPPQPSDVTSVVHVTQVNMNVNIPTPLQPSDVTSVAHASISRATCIQSAKMTKTLGSLMAPSAKTNTLEKSGTRIPGDRSANYVTWRRITKNVTSRCVTLHYWLVVSIFFIFHNIWDNPSHWLSYFSRWLSHHQPDCIRIQLGLLCLFHWDYYFGTAYHLLCKICMKSPDIHCLTGISHKCHYIP